MNSLLPDDFRDRRDRYNGGQPIAVSAYHPGRFHLPGSTAWSYQTSVVQIHEVLERIDRGNPYELVMILNACSSVHATPYRRQALMQMM